MVDEQRKPLSPSAYRIQETLFSLGLSCKVVEFQDSTRTSAEAGERVGCQIGQIVKSLIFRVSVSGKPVLVLTSGVNRVDETLISRYVGESISRADAEFARTSTGYAIGGIPPVGHNRPLLTFLDEDLMQYSKVWAAAGTPNAVFETTPNDLQIISGTTPVKVKV